MHDLIIPTPEARGRTTPAGRGLRILNVTLRNFLSVGQVTQTIVLTLNPLTLVMGQNLDTATGENAARNGAGKTVLPNAISYGLFGVPLEKIKADNLINNINGKGMLVSIDFEKDGRRYRIERGRKPSIFRFTVDGESPGDTPQDDTQGESRDTQEVINEILGMTPLMFSHIVGLNTSTDPFLKLAAAKQREVIEELLGITVLSQKAEALKEQINGNPARGVLGTKQEIKQQEFEIRTLTEQNGRIERTLTETKLKQKSWAARHQAKLEELRTTAAALAEIDYEAELAVFDAIEAYGRRLAEFEAAEREIERLASASDAESTALLEEANLLRQQARLKRQEMRDPEREAETLRRLIRPYDESLVTRRLEADRSRYRGEIQAVDQDLSRLAAEVERLDAILEAPDALSCSTCGQSLRDGDHRDHVVATVTGDRDAVMNRICTVMASRQRLETALEGLDAEQSRAVVLKEQADTENLRVTAEIETTTAAIVETNKRLESEAKALEKKAKTRSDKSDRIIEQAEALEEQQLAALAEAKAALGPCPTSMFRNRDHVWQARATSEQVAKELAAEEILVNPYDEQVASWQASLIEIDYGRINYLTRLKDHQDALLKLLTDKGSFIRKRIIDQNLAFLNTRLSYHLARLGLPHSVRFLNDLSVEITQFGKDLDYDNLSKGEKNRLIMSLAWSFRDIFEHLKHPINLMLVDELADSGMDPLGVELSFEAMRSMARERGKNILLISHREELISRCEATLLARKEGGFTVYEPDGVAD
jgi:DNA repair exonuclease SbcCD ATPase subunit